MSYSSTLSDKEILLSNTKYFKIREVCLSRFYTDIKKICGKKILGQTIVLLVILLVLLVLLLVLHVLVLLHSITGTISSINCTLTSITGTITSITCTISRYTGTFTSIMSYSLLFKISPPIACVDFSSSS